MKILTSKPLPTLEELAEILRQEFSTEYDYDFFGWGPGRSVMVRKTAFVGARIILRPEKGFLRVDGAFPSLGVQLMFGGILVIAFVYPKWKKLSREVGDFLEQKYG